MLTLRILTRAAALALIHPFQWQHVYIPILPPVHSDFLNAPVPYLMGMPTQGYDLSNLPPEVVWVNLDENQIRLPSDPDLLMADLAFSVPLPPIDMGDSPPADASSSAFLVARCYAASSLHS